MKTLVKLILAGLGIGAVGFLVKREYDKAKTRQEQADQKFEQELKDSGISKESYEREIVTEEDENDLTKKTYLALALSPEIDIDDINVSKFIDKGAENIIHLRTSQFRGMPTFDFLMEIPKYYVGWNKRDIPNIKDYLSYFSGPVKEQLIKLTSLEVKTRLEGYYMISCNNGEDCISVRIPEEDYSPYADNSSDGLSNYIIELSVNDQLRKDLIIDDFRLRDVKNYEVVEAILVFKLSMPRKTNNYPHGLTVKSVKTVLKYLTDEDQVFVSKSGNDKNVITYPYIMANTEDKFGIWSIAEYYCMSKGRIYVDQLSYDEGE